MTGEGLGYKPGVVEQDKFGCFPLGKAFNKGLKKRLKKDFWKDYKMLKAKMKNN